MNRLVTLLLICVLLALLLVACDGDATPSPPSPLILSVVTATPEFIGPQPVPSVSPREPQPNRQASATPG